MIVNANWEAILPGDRRNQNTIGKWKLDPPTSGFFLSVSCMNIRSLTCQQVRLSFWGELKCITVDVHIFRLTLKAWSSKCCWEIAVVFMSMVGAKWGWTNPEPCCVERCWLIWVPWTTDLYWGSYVPLQLAKELNCCSVITMSICTAHFGRQGQNF